MIRVQEFDWRQSASRFTALHLATHLGHEHHVQLLLSASATAVDARTLPGATGELRYPFESVYLSEIDRSLNTPLHFAADDLCARALVSRGASLMSQNFRLEVAGARHAACLPLVVRETLDVLRACHRVFPSEITLIILEHIVGLHLSEHMHRSLQVELSPGHWPLMAVALSNKGHGDALAPFAAGIAAAVDFGAASGDGYHDSINDRAGAPEVSPVLHNVMARLLLEYKYAAGQVLLAEWKQVVRASKRVPV